MSWYEIADAEAQDMDFILELASTASADTFNRLRSTPQERAYYLHSEFRELQRYAQRGLYRFLLARDKASGERIGYLLLNLHHLDDLGRRQTFVEDLAALPEYWGRGIGHALFDAATEITAEMGIDFMGGEVAGGNPRWKAALRNNFFLEAYRVVRPCTPEGVALLARVKEECERQEAIQEKVRVAQERRRARKERRNKTVE